MIENQQIVLTAILQGARMTTDSGWRVSFDLDESQTSEITALAKLKNKSLIVVVTVRNKAENLECDFSID